jgi:L-ascorbate metabolism protein UlaG (beta-lactamase superfamily)
VGDQCDHINPESFGLVLSKENIIMQITMIGHSTVLVETEGKKILTDPCFTGWGNPAYARPVPSARTRQALVDIDLLLVSHNHWDHIDRRFFHLLPASVPVIVPDRAKWLTSLYGAKNLVGLKAWQEWRLGTITVVAVPASHGAVTLGYVIQAEGKQVYFAGDTYYGPFMQEIGRRFSLDVALIPVTTYRIPMTMGEKGAVRAVGALKPAVVIPIHLGLRPRSPLLRTGETPDGFIQRAQQAGLTTCVIVLREGESHRI